MAQSSLDKKALESRHPTDRRRRWLRTADWPILVRTLVGMIGVLALTQAILAATNLFMVQSIVRDAAGQQFELLAQAQMSQIGGFLSENITLVRSIALPRRVREELVLSRIRHRGQTPAEIEQQLLDLDAQWVAAPDDSYLVRSLVDPSQSWLARQLVEYYNDFPDHVEIFVTDLYGGLVAATGRTSDYYQADEAWWQAAYNGGKGAIYISQPRYDESAGYMALDVAAPVHDDEGTVLGIVRSTLRVEAIQSMVSELRMGETGYVVLLDAQGRVIASPKESIDEQMPAPWFAAEIIESDAGWTTLTGPKEESLLTGYATLNDFETEYPAEMAAIRNLNWVLYVRQTESEALAAVRDVVQTGRLASIAALLLALVLAFWLARSLSRPIRQLVDVARQMTSGNLRAQIPFRRQDEVGELALAFEDLASQVSDTVNTLEQRVVERTRNLETAAEVSNVTISVLDPSVLLPQVVELVRERFGYYYVGLFLVDKRSEYAVLQAGSGEAGHQMMAQGWRLAINAESMIGRCVSRNEAEIALDVGAAPSRFDNPFLPDTRSEMALPLRARGPSGDSVVIGAMTVQSDRRLAFDEADVSLMQTVADQVATAISNARLFRQAQESLEAARRAYGELAGQAWQALLAATPDLGFVEDARGLASVGDYWDTEMIEAVRQAQPVSGGEKALAVPILSRGQVVAVIDAHFPADGGTWTPEQTQLLQSLAEQLGVALESARLYQDTQRVAARERMLREATAHIRSSTDPETVLHSLLRQVGTVLNRPAVVRLVSSDEEISADDGPSTAKVGADAQETGPVERMAN